MDKTRSMVGMLIVAACVASAGCAERAPSEHLGETRASLRVEADAATTRALSIDPTVPGERLAVIWSSYATCDGPVEECFEASPAAVIAEGGGYRLTIDEPPSERILAGSGFLFEDPNAVRVVRGLVAIIDPAVDPRRPPFGSIRALAPNYMVAYAEEDVADDTLAGVMLHASIGRGFHLIEISYPTYDPDALFDLDDPAPGWECFEANGTCWGGVHMTPAADGFATIVRVAPVDLVTPLEAQSPESLANLWVTSLPFW